MTPLFLNRSIKRYLFLLFCSLSHLLCYSQSIINVDELASSVLENKIDVPDYKGSAKELLSRIEKENPIIFSYSTNVLLNYEVSFQKMQLELMEFLDILLKGSSITYKACWVKVILYNKKASTWESGKLSQTIRGTVLDRDSNIPLPGANIIILNTSPLIGSVSDPDGNFALKNVPLGRHTIQVSFMGYLDKTIPEILVGSAKELFLTIKIEEIINEIDEVTIRPNEKGSPKNQMATVSARSFSVEESSRYAASISDPGRMALSFAGVNCNDDATNQIVIRGNSPNGLLWKVEGVEIPYPNHFMEQGFDPGAVSILSTNMIGQSDFFTGAFPAEYGNATSGVFDIGFRNGNNQKTEKTLQFGLLGAEMAIEGPFSKKYNGSYLVNYRYSTLGILGHLGAIAGFKNSFPKYTDLSFKVNLPTKKAGTFSIWGLGGKSYMGYIPSAKDTLSYPDEPIYPGYETTTFMGATGINHIYFLGSKSYIKTSISYSGDGYNDEAYEYDTLFQNRFDSYSANLASTALRNSLLYNVKAGSRLTIRSGLTYSLLFYDVMSRNKDEDLNIWLYHRNDKGTTSSYQAFLQSKYKINDQLSINLGVHYLLFNLNKKYSLEPRAGLTWKLPKGQTIGVGIGLHSTIEPLIFYFYKDSINGSWDYLNQDLDLQKSMHYVLSYSKMFNRNLYFKAEIYYQDLTNVPISADSTKAYSTINDRNTKFKATSEGVGRNCGIELTLEKFFTNNYYFLATASIFDSKYKPLSGKWLNTRYNNKFIINFSGGKEWKVKDNNLIGGNVRFLFSGGKRDTPYDEIKMVEQGDGTTGRYYHEDRMWEKQYKPYIRLDLGCSYRINKLNRSHIFSLDIQNSTFIKNIGGSYWDEKEGKAVEYTMMPLIPVISYRLEF